MPQIDTLWLAPLGTALAHDGDRFTKLNSWSEGVPNIVMSYDMNYEPIAGHGTLNRPTVSSGSDSTATYRTACIANILDGPPYEACMINGERHYDIIQYTSYTPAADASTTWLTASPLEDEILAAVTTRTVQRTYSDWEPCATGDTIMVSGKPEHECKYDLRLRTVVAGTSIYRVSTGPGGSATPAKLVWADTALSGKRVWWMRVAEGGRELLLAEGIENGEWTDSPSYSSDRQCKLVWRDLEYGVVRKRLSMARACETYGFSGHGTNAPLRSSTPRTQAAPGRHGRASALGNRAALVRPGTNR